MKPRHLTFVLVLLASTSLHAQDGPPPAGHRPPSPLIEALDTDKDHKLSADELTAAPSSLLKLDADGDGSLSKDELRPKPPGKKDAESTEADSKESTDEPQGPPPEEKEDRKRPVPPLIAALDTDKDGTLSATEIQNATESLKTLDENKDGELTRDELRPKRPEGDEAGHQGPPHGGKGSRSGRPPGPPRE